MGLFLTLMQEKQRSQKNFYYLVGQFKSQVQLRLKKPQDMRHQTLWILKNNGISVATSVMGFIYDNKKVNILDTPGHKDFCEDTYHTLTAVNSVIMVIDSTKGVETQTLKLMEVCRMRDTPIIIHQQNGSCWYITDRTFDNIESNLNITVCPLSWPIGSGKEFQGYIIYILTNLFYISPTKNKIHTTPLK